MQTKVNQELLELETILHSAQFISVRRRIFRQLIESLIYEDVIQAQSTVVSKDIIEFKVKGRDRAGQSVSYLAYGKRRMSFNRIRLLQEPILRIADNSKAEAISLATFLIEIFSFSDIDAGRLATFIDEIQQTLLKDAIAQYKRSQSSRLTRDGSYDDLEGDVMDGHPYHPCYKSRIGFDLTDNINYAPDFQPEFSLFWIAIHKENVCISTTDTIAPLQFIQHELGEKDYINFAEKLKTLGHNPEEYVFLPVHPWQWRSRISIQFIEAIAEQRLIPLGIGTDRYRPQQSIRTLANQTCPHKYYVKLPLSITNTSTSRILAPHTVSNAAKISDWLTKIHEQDRYLKQELKLILLKEVLGISYHNQNLSDIQQQQVYGLLSTIWRESLVTYLQADEAAIPFNALCHIDIDGYPFIQPWIEQWGIENWLEQVLKVTVLPLIHLLFAHGIAMEAHAQNIVLIHRSGSPTRIALKDFHDGIRFSRDALREPSLCPILQATPAHHARINRNSFVETDDIAAVRDFMHDAFFFINIAEFAMFLEDNYGFQEYKFWLKVTKIILSYQSKFSHLKPQFEKFDLFTETIQVEQLTKRRLFPETEIRVQAALNPLFSVRQGVTISC